MLIKNVLLHKMKIVTIIIHVTHITIDNNSMTIQIIQILIIKGPDNPTCKLLPMITKQM